ncbi:MAG: SPFH domain-containing protein [Desulfomonile tiedjei]|uniref:SPFH domain-containing protein n=1 Tax=Desulfomonile tiedjei TaxID=2358 RepID=A0A9D6V7F2_9BACT|nr:SPFH domain-containing protein [Desulfomonile tiedjei]
MDALILLFFVIGAAVAAVVGFKGFITVKPREGVVILSFGAYRGTIDSEGIHWVFPFGCRLIRIPTSEITLEVATATVVDGHGNPIQVGAVVVYRVKDIRKAVLEVENFRTFIENKAGAVIKGVSARFPYHSSNPEAPCLKGENETVRRTYIKELQKAVESAGIDVLDVRLNDLTYAPEIAQAMLMRQQALALIEARKTIVDGAVAIVCDALNKLQAAGIQMADSQKEVLISNLLVVLCSGERAQPVMQVQAQSPSYRLPVSD